MFNHFAFPHLRRWLKLLAWGLSLLLLSLVALWAALQWFILPRIDEFRPQITEATANALGKQVTMGPIQLLSRGWMPVLQLHDVHILNERGEAALALQRITVVLSPLSMWQLEPYLAHIEVDGVDIEVRRLADGRVLVAGLDVSQPGQSPKAANWFFNQGEFELKNGRLRWLDESRQAPPLALQEVSIHIRNWGLWHRLQLNATPSEGWGQRFQLSAHMRHAPLSPDPGDARQWIGELQADLPDMDLQRLRLYAQLPISVLSGQGALQVKAQVHHGEWGELQAKLNMQALSLRLAPDLPPLHLKAVNGELHGEQAADSFWVQGQGLRFTTEEDTTWSPTDFRFDWATSPSAVFSRSGAAQQHLKANQLDLHMLTRLAPHLPLPLNTHQQIVDWGLQGQVKNLDAQWQGDARDARSYKVKAELQNFSMKAEHKPPQAQAYLRPGIAGLSMSFEASDTGGKARVELQKGLVDLPGWFEISEIPIEQLSGQLTWRISSQGLELDFKNMSLSNPDLMAKFEGSWDSRGALLQRQGKPPQRPGVVQLKGQLSRVNGAHIARYLPLTLSEEARHYVRDSILEGVMPTADFKLHGDLAFFPFGPGPDFGKGEFSVVAQVEKTRFAYAPPLPGRKESSWPVLEEVHGTLRFDNARVQLLNVKAQMLGEQLQNIQAEIPDQMATPTWVKVQADARGSFTDVLRVSNQAALSEILEHRFARSQGNGPLEAQIALELPIEDPAQARLKMALKLNQNDFQLDAESPKLQKISGKVDITEQGFGVKGLTGRALGGEWRVEGGLFKDQAQSQIKGQGVITAEGLAKAREWGLLSRVGQAASGQASYQLSVTQKQGHTEWSVYSDGVGLGLNLPPPLRKAPEMAMPLKIQNTLEPLTNRRTQVTDRLSLEWGKALSALYQRDLSGADARVLRGSIALGEGPAILPPSGISGNFVFQQLALDPWLSLLSNNTAALPTTTSSNDAGTKADTRPLKNSAYAPTALILRAKQLSTQGRTLDNVVINGTSGQGLLKAQLESDQLTGYAEYREGNANAPGRLLARLSKFSLEDSGANDVLDALESQSALIPTLDVTIDRFSLYGKDLGRVEISAINRPNSSAAGNPANPTSYEWRLNKLLLTVPEAKLSATGSWLPALSGNIGQSRNAPLRGPRRTALNFKLEVSDAGALLDRLGFKGAMRKGNGKLEGLVDWRGSPMHFDLGSLNGQMKLDVNTGQFLKSDPGLARLLGVLSLQSLPRRITLDFRDFFSEGFAYDNFSGDVQINNAVAFTNNLRMRGVAATVFMEGSAHLMEETQNLHVVVVPEINAGSASLAYATVNPALGLGSFLAQWILRKPLMQSYTYEYQITGPWKDPLVTPLERKKPEAAK